VTVKEEEEGDETAVVDIIVIFSRTQKRILCDAIEYRYMMIYFSPRRSCNFVLLRHHKTEEEDFFFFCEWRDLSTETIATGEIFNRHNSAMFSAISLENSTPEREASSRKLSSTVYFMSSL